jgi:HEAT repeat protein
VRNREEVRKCDGLRHCLRIVKVKEERDLIEDLKALKELAKNDKNKVVLREGRLIESVVPMILPPNQPIQELVLDLLCIMSMNDVKSQVTVRDARGLPPIMKELDNTEVEVRRRAARTLGAVSQNNRKIQGEVRKAKDVVKRVVDMMKEPNEEVKKAAAGACAALAENDCMWREMKRWRERERERDGGR